MSDIRETGVVGSFEHMDSLIEAIAKVREAGYHDLEVYSPVPRHEIEAALARPKSPVKFITFIGAVSGLVTAFALTILSSLIWNMIVGGKPIISIVPFLVPAFELTILFGGIATLLAIFHFSRVPSRRAKAHHPRFSDDRFGLFVRAQVGCEAKLARMLAEAHAEESWPVGRDEPGQEPAEDDCGPEVKS